MRLRSCARVLSLPLALSHMRMPLARPCTPAARRPIVRCLPVATAVTCRHVHHCLKGRGVEREREPALPLPSLSGFYYVSFVWVLGVMPAAVVDVYSAVAVAGLVRAFGLWLVAALCVSRSHRTTRKSWPAFLTH